jgi:hypothetical protein
VWRTRRQEGATRNTEDSNHTLRPQVKEVKMSPLERTASNKSVLMRTDLSKNER